MLSKDDFTRKLLRRAIPVVAAMLLEPLSGRALATLGGSAQSVAADQQALGGTLNTAPQAQASGGAQALNQSSANPAYTVQQISIPSGTTINEYVSSDGKVFAVSWRGQRPPDLAQLFGSYFAQYQQAAAAPHRERGHRAIQTQDLVVETGGHMRDLMGRAYIPALVPAGVSVDEIQ